MQYTSPPLDRLQNACYYATVLIVLIQLILLKEADDVSD